MSRSVTRMKKFRLTVPGRKRISYPVVVESKALNRIPSLVKEWTDVRSVIVLYDKGVEGIAQRISGLLPGSQMIAVAQGEDSKCVQQVERIAQDMLLKKANRSTLLICVGGGMLTDLGGFLAAVFMRGIAHMQVPTTLMGMADAAIGGDAVINVGRLKNVLGTVWHPRAVVVDTDILGGLQAQPFNRGMIEVVKTAAMLDREFFGWLEENIFRVLDREESAIETCLGNAVRLKIDTAGKDEHGINHRLLLHFGHTVGHAVEALSQFTVSHGEAVSIGMVSEMEMMGTKDRDRILKLMETLDLPMSIPLEMDGNALWEIMLNDRKVVDGNVRISAPKQIGGGEVAVITKEQFLHSRW